MEKTIKSFSLALAISTIFSSCATILSDSKYDVTINSSPSQSNVRVLDRKGVEVASGQTPLILRLKSGAGFFKSAKYTLEFSKEGYETKQLPLEASFDGWYIGNLVFGGLIGFLIVDPATGAMWKIEDTLINTTLVPKSKQIAVAKDEFGNKVPVYSISDIPAEMHKHLVSVSK